MKCSCCGRSVDGAGICKYCGMLLHDDNAPANDKNSSQAALKYRNFIICNIVDITIAFPQSVSQSHRICNAWDCYERILWSKVEFPPYSGMATIKMNVAGAEKHIDISIDEKAPWKIGFAINKNLSIYSYIGTESFHLCSGPRDLPLKKGVST